MNKKSGAIGTISVAFIFPILIAIITGCKNPRKADNQILNKQQVLKKQGNWWDNKDWAWYEKNIPFFDSPDSAINQMYYYRWELVTKHMVYGSPKTGYLFTEFMNRPFWSGRYGAISCPLGHQFYELRWLKNRRVVRDYARYWFETPGAEPRSYSNWYSDAMWGIYKVNHDKNFLKNVYPYMKKQYHGFVKEHYNYKYGLFMWNGARDGMEFNINSRLTKNQFSGGEGYRPTLNSYMYGGLRALSGATQILGDTSAAETYNRKAQKLKKRVEDELWDPDRQFFEHEFAFDKANGIKAYTKTYESGKYAGNSHGREEIGYVPWQFELPDSGYAEAWKYLMDKDYFYSAYGPTTVEQNDPQFMVSDNCCVWSGQSWPYATTQTLVGMANLLHDYHQDVVTKQDYFKLLKVYTKTQHKNGRPYIAEAANPFTRSWKGYDHYYHSEHYFHSGYVNNIITGLVGLRPHVGDTLEVDPLIPNDWDYFALEDVSYHGHNVSVVWDEDGSHYNKGKGLLLFVDGNQVASSDNIKDLKVHINSIDQMSLPQQPINFAVNNGRGYFPHISASYSNPTHMLYYANDGNYWYHKSPANRWTTEGSDSDQQWIKIDYGTKRPIKTVKLYFLDDGKGVVAPQSYHVQVWKDGQWIAVSDLSKSPEEPAGHRANVATFDHVEHTAKVRVLMTPAEGQALGLTEFETWGKADLPLDIPTAEVKDLAYNEHGEEYPQLSASYTADGSQLSAVNDLKGLVPYNASDHWTARNSKHSRDWIVINFGPRKQVNSVDVLFWGRGNAIGAPKDYHLEYWDGSDWKRADDVRKNPQTPVSMAVNSITLNQPIFTNKIRLIFEHDLPKHTGINEIMVR